MSRIFAIRAIYNLGYRISYNNSTKYMNEAPQEIVKQLFNNRDKYIEPEKCLSLEIHLHEISNDKVYKYLIKENTDKKYDNVIDMNTDNNNNNK